MDTFAHTEKQLEAAMAAAGAPCTRKTIREKLRLPGAPKKTSDGWNVAAVVDWIRGTANKTSASEPKVTGDSSDAGDFGTLLRQIKIAERDRKRADARTARVKCRQAEGKSLDAEEFARKFYAREIEIFNMLRQRLEFDAAATLEGKSLVERRVYFSRLVDEIGEMHREFYIRAGLPPMPAVNTRATTES